MFQIRGMCFSNRLTIYKVITKVRHSCVIIYRAIHNRIYSSKNSTKYAVDKK